MLAALFVVPFCIHDTEELDLSSSLSLIFSILVVVYIVYLAVGYPESDPFGLVAEIRLYIEVHSEFLSQHCGTSR